MKVRAGWITILAAIAWCGFIFGTSSTVILSNRFFGWIGSHVLTDAESLRRFRIFWALSWFAIVKGWHATEFAFLFVLVKRLLDRIARPRPARNLVASLAFCVLFAMSDEYHQTFVPGRGGNWLDVGIDGLGASFAAIASKAVGTRPPV